MKTSLTLIATTLLISCAVSAQETLTPSRLTGTWKMMLDMDPIQKELQAEAEDSETVFEEVILESVSGVMDGISKKIQVYFKFRDSGKAHIYVDAFDEATERELTYWEIRNNRLYIDDSDRFSSDDDDNWVLEDGILYLKDHGTGDHDVTVYMTKVD